MSHTQIAARTPLLRQETAATPAITCLKKLAESPNLNSIPSNYAYYTNPVETTASDPDESIPTIDLSLLTSDDPDQKAKAIQELGRACQEWGFFMVVNHGIPEALMKAMLEVTNEFFNLPEEEKPEFQPKNVLEPIRYGTNFNTAKEKMFCWRDFLKAHVHPAFHCPDKPQSLRKLLLEYGERTRDVVRKLLKGISESLGLQEDEIEKAMEVECSFQIFVANYYPCCPNPDVALGLPPHSDEGLLTLLLHNEVGGLQIQHKGKWVNVNALPNSVLINIGDLLEVFSNGKYKSVLHRAVVNNQKTRISIAMFSGPSLEAIVCPAPQLVQTQCYEPMYIPMKYKDYLFSYQNNQLNGKAMLKRIQEREEKFTL